MNISVNMIHSVVLSAATQGVRTLGRKAKTVSSSQDLEPTIPETESESTSLEQASCKCPHCDEHTDVRGVYMLAPEEKHTEPCSNCGLDILMWYDHQGNWSVEPVE